MLRPCIAIAVFSTAVTALESTAASIQEFPSKLIRIVTQGVGSSSDFAARLLAQGVTELLGQQVIVDNRPNGLIPTQVVLQASPDGYTVLVLGNSFWTGSLVQKLPYDPIKDFSPITLIARQPNLLVVNPSLPAKSVRELIALAKAKPGNLNYASAGTGGSAHLAAELFKAMAGVNIVHVPYKDGSTEMAELIGGQTQLTIAPAASVMPYVNSGKLRSLAVTSAQPSELYPGLQTVASVLPGYEAVTYHTAFVSAKTPTEIINRLNKEMVQFLRSSLAKREYLKGGAESIGSTSAELAATMTSELSRMGKVVRDAGIHVD